MDIKNNLNGFSFFSGVKKKETENEIVYAHFHLFLDEGKMFPSQR